MRRYLTDNLQFIFVILMWTLLGIFFWQSLLIIVPATLFAFIKRDMYVEVFVGFWFFLVLSDSYIYELAFAKQMKVVYMLLLGLMLYVRRKQLVVYKNQIITIFLPFFLLGFVLVFWSPYPEVSFQKTLSYFLLFLIVPTLVNYFLKTDERMFFRKIVYFGIFLLTLGVVFHIVGFAWVSLLGRFSGMLGNPNGLGLFSAMMFLLYKMTVHLRPDTFTRKEKIFIMMMILINIALCQSRTSFFMIVIYYVFVRINKLSPILGFLVLIILTVTYQSLLLYLPTIVSFLGVEEFMRVDTIESGSGRIIAWNFAWEEIKNYNILFGRGIGYTEYFFEVNYHKLSRAGHLGNAHNSYLTFWLDTGIVGLLLYVVPLVVLILGAAKRYVVAIPFLFAIVFSTNFESWLTASLNPTTIIFLVILSVVTSPVRGMSFNNTKNINHAY